MPWTDGHGRITRREGWLIRIETAGLVGAGDCAPLASAGTEPYDTAADWLQKHIQQLTGRHPGELLDWLDRQTDIPPASRCGIETAVIDLLSQQQGVSLSRWLNRDSLDEIKVNAALGPLKTFTPKQLPEPGRWPLLKLKVGLAPVDEEIAQLRQLATRLPEGTRVRLDANQAWTPAEAASFLSRCAGLPIESIEEPLTNPDIDALRQLQQKTPVPIALDESFVRLDRAAVLRSPPVKRLTIKPMVAGGLRAALRLAQEAQVHGMEVVVTTTVDSAVGTWGAAHLAAALGNDGRDSIHGLATSQWLAKDVGRAPVIHNGLIRGLTRPASLHSFLEAATCTTATP